VIEAQGLVTDDPPVCWSGLSEGADYQNLGEGVCCRRCSSSLRRDWHHALLLSLWMVSLTRRTLEI